MKVKFCCDNHANSQSKKEETLDTEDIGYTKKEWRGLSEDEKFYAVEEWMNNYLEYWYEELE